MQAFLSYISSLDSSMLYTIQSAGPAWKILATFLSSVLSYEGMAVIFVISLFLIRRHRVALELIVIVIASLAATYVLKLVFHAPRPYIVDPRVIAYATDSSSGLPSAHALMSVVILGWMWIRHPKSRILLWGSIVLIVLIGWSRVYLGVHYPSQVLAGWLFGILFLFIFHAIGKKLWSPFEKKLGKRK